ncbi:hypothetical protein [Ruegeria lacuscaerulensis]|uniref:hypothetical protein n=1 Tax=Ruegeria lacuscaerulensis TaxID=55218 RepID=UPI001BE4405B|nr:hypothetical protein [Ruegeria lacuscaerulensis]
MLSGAYSVPGLSSCIVKDLIDGLDEIDLIDIAILPGMAYSALHLLSKALYPFGSDRCGMEVSVSGKLDGHLITHTWKLIAEKGHGPFVPGVMCRAILREHANINVGARPCLAELPRPIVERAMGDMEIRTGLVELPDQHAFVPRRADKAGRYLGQPDKSGDKI